uniref:Secreted protein n=1 Tax=Parascaris univalens TaxID=6257 RepID=A0A914ZIN2_PARUN
MSSPPSQSKFFSISRARTESTASTDSEKMGTSVPERRFSISEILGRRTSIEDAYKKYAKFTTNGDGFQRENYEKK